MLKNFILRHPDILLLIFLGCFVLFLDIRPLTQCMAGTPPGARHTAVRGHPGDYYQYVYMIQRGIDGHLAFHNAYTDETIPDVILQPIYPLAGMIFGWLPIQAVSIYHIIRIASLVTLWLGVYLLIRIMLPGIPARISAVLLFMTSGGYWLPATYWPLSIINLGLPYNPFPLFVRFHTLPPHHSLIIAFIMFAFIRYTKKLWTPGNTIAVFVLTVAIGFLNPYLHYIYIALLGADFLLGLILHPTRRIEYTKRFAVIIASSVPVLLYHLVIVTVILKTYSSNTLLFGGNSIPFTAYLASLGPLLLLSVPAAFFISWKDPFKRLILLWGFLPLLLYFFPNIHIPISVYRMFEIYQYVPFAVLAAYTIWHISMRFIRFKFLIWIIPIACSLYGAVPYAVSYLEYKEQLKSPQSCTVLSKHTTEVFHYFKSSTPADAVVLTDEILGSILPTFTNSKVIVGHEGNNNRLYTQNLAWVQSFYGNELTPDEVKEFIYGHHIRYVVFGFTTSEFAQSAYTDLFEPVFISDTLTVAKVK